MRRRVIDCALSIILVVALIVACISFIGTLYERTFDRKATHYIVTTTEDGDKPYIVATARAQSNSVKGRLWLVTLQQDGDNVSYWVHYYKGVWSHETICAY